MRKAHSWSLHGQLSSRPLHIAAIVASGRTNTPRLSRASGARLRPEPGRGLSPVDSRSTPAPALAHTAATHQPHQDPASTMKLLFSPTSPYVRKCLAVAIECRLVDRIERIASAAHPIQRDATIVAVNPLGKVPTLLTDDGQSLYDSRVIAEYLNDLGGGSLFPSAGPRRWQALTLQALGDGILDAALLARYEQAARSEGQRSKPWLDGQLDKIATSLADLETHTDELADRVDIGTLSLGCALWYLDLRFSDLGWRAAHPRLAEWQAGFAQRESMKRDWSA